MHIDVCVHRNLHPHCTTFRSREHHECNKWSIVSNVSIYYTDGYIVLNNQIYHRSYVTNYGYIYIECCCTMHAINQIHLTLHSEHDQTQFYPCSYTGNCLKCQKSLKLTNILIHVFGYNYTATN